jgi:hypothetical protein
MSDIDPRVQRALDRLERFRLSGEEIKALFSESAVFTGQDDFRIPTMPKGRGRSAGGGVSFHFKSDIVSRKAVPILDGKPYLLGGAGFRNAGKFEAYLRRDHSAEDVGLGQITYISRLGAEQAISDEEAEPADGFPPIISNISSVAAQREEYWRTVWDHLKPPTTNYLIARPEASPDFWTTLNEQTQLPQKLLTYLLDVRAAYLEHQRNGAAPREKFRVEKLKVSAEEAGEFLAAVRQLGVRAQPVLFKSGRGGRHQYQMAIELPHTLPPAARWRIMNSFCQELRSLGLMYTAAHHRAGDHGDSRNCHFHVIFHDRPAGLMRVAKDVAARTIERPGGPPGVETILLWDFDVAIPGGHKKNARRLTYPFAQLKVDRVGQSFRRTRNANSGRGFFKWLRAKYAEIVNAALEKYAQAYHYDPRKYKEMGVDWAPTKHLGPKLAALEALGIATLQGSRNAILRYQNLEKDLATECRRRIQAATNGRKEVERRLAEGPSPFGTDAGFRVLAQTRELMEQQQARAQWSLQLLELRRDAAESRALRADAAPYGGDIKRSRRQVTLVNERAKKGGEYFDQLYHAMEPTQAGIDEVAAECLKRAKDLKQINEEIERRLSSPHFVTPFVEAAPRASGETGILRGSSPKPAGIPTERSRHAVNEKAPTPSVAAPPAVDRDKTRYHRPPAVGPATGKPPARPMTARSEAVDRPSIDLSDRHLLQEPVVPLERRGLRGADGTIEKFLGDGASVGKPIMTAHSRGVSSPPPRNEVAEARPQFEAARPRQEQVARGEPPAVTSPHHQAPAVTDKEARAVQSKPAAHREPPPITAPLILHGKAPNVAKVGPGGSVASNPGAEAAIANESERAVSKQVVPPEAKETVAEDSSEERTELLDALPQRTQAIEGLEESTRRLEMSHENAGTTQTPAYSAPQPRTAMPATAPLHSDDEWEIAIQDIDKLGYLITYDDQLKTFAVPRLGEDQAAIVFHPDREKATQARLSAIWRETAAPSVQLEKGPDDLHVDRELKQARDLAVLQAASKAPGR